jgi:hypothetical protein
MASLNRRPDMAVKGRKMLTKWGLNQQKCWKNGDIVEYRWEICRCLAIGIIMIMNGFLDTGTIMACANK